MPERCAEYAALKQRILRGWNTWNTRSVTSHVLLPQGLALNLAFKSYAHNAYLKEPLIGRKRPGDEIVRPGPHAMDGSYTSLELTWKDVACRVETAHDDAGHLVMLVTPLPTANATLPKPPLVVLEAGFLWNRPGHVSHLSVPGGPGTPTRALAAAVSPAERLPVFPTREPVDEPHVPAQSAYMAVPLDAPVGFSTGSHRSTGQIRALLDARRDAMATRLPGELGEVHDAIATVMAWDTIYDPLKDRAVSTVSRIWNVGGRSGWVLFCWDNFFAGTLAAAVGARDLAYANVIEIMREATPEGFVPNNSQASGRVSRDRSQPPVGALSVLALFEAFQERWLLEELFEPLLKWNRWWDARRRQGDLLCWGSNPFVPVVGDPRESDQPNTLLGAALESGLDNSPMYDADEVTFDPDTHLMCLHDVGLNSLYIADCRALEKIARALGRDAEAAEIAARGDALLAAMDTLWDEPSGLFLNRRTTDGSFSRRLSPTHFYPLLAGVSRERADRLIAEHLLNPAEFWGEWVLPSIARSDGAYPQQDYWRGPVWAPMNWLVYLGLRHYHSPTATSARRQLVERSRALLLKEWRSHRHVHENYSSITGQGCQAPAAARSVYDPHAVGTVTDSTGARSDAFYHWGALLGVMSLWEHAE